MIEARQALKEDIGQKQYSMSMYEGEACQIGVLSSIFSLLVEIIKEQKSLYCDNIESGTEKKSPALYKSILFTLLHRCLHISEPGNGELLSSALLLAGVIGYDHLKRSLSKLSHIISTPCLDFSKDSFESLVLQKKDVQQAYEKMEVLKLRRLDSSSIRAVNSSTLSTSKWTVVESWKPCPIGMLPRTLGSSGCLPLLDCKNKPKETSETVSRKEEQGTLNFTGNEKGKRRASSDLRELSNKRLQVSKHNDENSMRDWCRGRLLMNGVLRRVEEEEEEEVKRIQSHIRILAHSAGLEFCS